MLTGKLNGPHRKKRQLQALPDGLAVGVLLGSVG
jgi:hypothetical protein